MREYETIYLLKPDLSPEQVKTVQEKVAELVRKHQGHVLVQTDWGKRRLAYSIQKLKFAQYIYMLYLDSGAAVSEIERILKYDDRVIRFLTVKVKDKVNVEERLAEPVKAPEAPEEIYSPQVEDSRTRHSAPPRRRSYEAAGDGVEETADEAQKETQLDAEVEA